MIDSREAFLSLKTRAVITIIRKLKRYIENNTRAPSCASKKMAVKKRNTCNLAEHREKGITSMVKNLVLFDRMILEPIRAGTLHPKPNKIITNPRPSSPIFSMNLSMINADLDK
jgi:hypothetical protein